MTPWICATCGVEFPAAEEPPGHCPICEDERQYVTPKGQQWTTMAELGAEHTLEVRALETDISGISIKPTFCIGQRAVFVERRDGGVLYDCVSLVTDAFIDQARGRGGLRAIVPSHPHFYGAMVTWSERFDNIPVWVHERDAHWVVRPSPVVRFWSGLTHEVAPGVTAIHVGGHFDGAQVLLVQGQDGQGVLLCADTINVAADTRWLSFMRSNPNYIPMAPSAVRHILKTLEPYAFERVYGSQWGKDVKADAKGTLSRSADRYLRAVEAAAVPA